MTEERAHVPGRAGAGRGRGRVALRQRLFEEDRRQGEEGDARAPQRPVDRPPAEAREQVRADERRDQRGHREDGDQRREGLRRHRGREAVAHHRPPEHGADARRHALHEAHRDEGAAGRAQRAADPREREGGDPPEEHGLPAEAVRRGADEELSDREAGEEEAQRELRLRGAELEEAGQVRQGREAHVDRERAHRREAGEERDEGPGSRVEGAHRAGVSHVCEPRGTRGAAG